MSRLALRSRFATGSGRTGRPLWALVASYSLFTLRASFTGRARFSLRAGISGQPTFALRPYWAGGRVFLNDLPDFRFRQAAGTCYHQ